jgi:pilus assembly protein Flp/PilA
MSNVAFGSPIGQFGYPARKILTPIGNILLFAPRFRIYCICSVGAQPKTTCFDLQKTSHQESYRSHMTTRTTKESTMKTQVMKFLQDEEGLTIVEYAVAAALISAAVLTAFTALGQAVIAKLAALTAAITANT